MLWSNYKGENDMKYEMPIIEIIELKIGEIVVTSGTGDEFNTDAPENWL